jgi:hypothetical protein
MSMQNKQNKPEASSHEDSGSRSRNRSGNKENLQMPTKVVVSIITSDEALFRKNTYMLSKADGLLPEEKHGHKTFSSLVLQLATVLGSSGSLVIQLMPVMYSSLSPPRYVTMYVCIRLSILQSTEYR